MAEFEETGRKEIFKGTVFRLEQRRVKGPGGTFVRDVIVHPGAVVLVPIVDGNVLLVRQWRHPLGYLTELPAGTLDPGEEPLETARREMREETGYRAGRLIALGQAYAAPGYSTELLHFYLAVDLARDPLPAPDDEDIEIVEVPLAEAVRRAQAGSFNDAKTALGLLVADSRLAGIREGSPT